MREFWKKLKNAVLLAMVAGLFAALLLPLIVAVLALLLPLSMLVFVGVFYLRGWKG